MPYIKGCFNRWKLSLLHERVAFQCRWVKLRCKVRITASLMWLEMLKPVIQMHCRGFCVVKQAQAASFLQRTYISTRNKIIIKLDEYCNQCNSIEDPWVRSLSKILLETGADVILNFDGFGKKAIFAFKKKRTYGKPQKHSSHRPGTHRSSMSIRRS